MAKITYDNKEIYTDGSTNSQYFRYQDANEIKSVVNANDTRLEHLYELLSQETTQTGTELTINNTFADNMKLDLKGNTEQYSTTGKNLLNVTANSTTINGITFTINEDKSVTANGTSTSTAALNLIGNNSFTLPVGQYFLSGCPSGGSDNTYRLDVNTGNVAGRIDYGNGSTFTLTESLSVTSVRVRVASGVTLNNVTFYPMIAEGSSASTYEPYTNGPSPNPQYPQQVKVVTGNNSVNIEGKNLNYLQNLKWIVNSSGVVVTNNMYWDAIIDTKNHNSIYISGDFSLLSDSAIRVGLFEDYPALNSQGVRATITSNGAIDTTNCNYVLLCYARTGEHTIDEIRNSFMVSYGNTQVPYTPYVSTSYPLNLSSLELCKIGDYQDYLYKDLTTNKWYKYSAIGKTTLNGSENWSKSSTTNIDRFIVNMDLPTSSASASTSTIKSSHFRAVNSTGTYGIGTMFLGTASSSPALFVDFSTYGTTSLANFKTWLSTNTPLLYHVLATPTSIEITDTTLKEQLDAIYNAQSYDYQTNITQTNAVLPFIITATARVERS